MPKGGEVVLWCRREDRGGELPVEKRERWCSHFETKPADSTTEECHSHCFPPNGQQFSTGRRNHASGLPHTRLKKATKIEVSHCIAVRAIPCGIHTACTSIPPNQIYHLTYLSKVSVNLKTCLWKLYINRAIRRFSRIVDREIEVTIRESPFEEVTIRWSP